MRLEVIADADRAIALRPEWSALLGRSIDPSVFLTPEWLESWWDAFGGGLEMHLVVVRDDARLVAVAPLALTESRAPGRARSALIGWSNDFTDRFGLAVESDGREAVETIARHLADLDGWAVLDLHPLVGSAEVTGWLADALRSVGCGVRIVPRWESPVVDLPGTYDELVGGLSGSFRSSLRRKIRAAEREGLVAEMRRDAAALGEAFDVAREGWAHREGTGIGSTPETERFYRNLADAAQERGWLRIALLRLGGEAVAFELNLIRDGSAYNLKVGYRESAASLSPGLVLRSHVMQSLISEGAASFDLLGEAEPYKLHWTARVVPHVKLRAFPATPRGRIMHLYRHRLRPMIGKALNLHRSSADGTG